MSENENRIIGAGRSDGRRKAMQALMMSAFIDAIVEPTYAPPTEHPRTSITRRNCHTCIIKDREYCRNCKEGKYD